MDNEATAFSQMKGISLVYGKWEARGRRAFERGVRAQHISMSSVHNPSGSGGRTIPSGHVFLCHYNVPNAFLNFSLLE